MGRSPCCSTEGLHRGAWTKEEDIILSEYIRIHGDGPGWTNIPPKTGLKRSGNSCRLRWLNYLRPDIKRGNISPDEEDLIIRLHRLLGNRWSLIAGRIPGRTDNEIKNYWNTRLGKKVLSMKESEPNSRTQKLKRRSKSPSPVQNHVIKTRPVKITMAVRHSEMVRPIDFNSSSDETFKLCNVEKTPGRIVEEEGRNSTCSTSSLEDKESGPHSDQIAGDTATLDDTLFDLDELSSPQWNLLFSPLDCSTDLGLEEFYTVAATEMNESKDMMCSNQSYMQRVHSFTVPDINEEMEELYPNTTRNT